MNFRTIIASIILTPVLLGSIAEAASSATEHYPTKPVTFIVPFPPGNTSDIMIRVIADKLQKKLGKPIIVENRPGAGGAIGVSLAQRAPADGYTFLVGTSGAFITVPIFQNKPLPAANFDAITLLAPTPHVLLARKDLPVDSMGDLIKLAKKEPGKLTFASLGNGSISDLSMALLMKEADISILQIPYKGSSQALNDILGGRVSLMVESIKGSTRQLVSSGALKALAVTSKDRVPFLPNVPTVAEAANLPDYESNSWIALFAPAGTPRAIIMKINQLIRLIIDEPAINKKLLELGVQPKPSSPDELTEVVRHETVKWQAFIKESGLKTE